MNRYVQPFSNCGILVIEKRAEFITTQIVTEYSIKVYHKHSSRQMSREDKSKPLQPD